MTMNNKQYWQQRHKQEKQYQLEQLKDVDKFNAKVGKVYDEILNDVEKDIDYDLKRIKGANIDPLLAQQLSAKLDNISDAATEWQNENMKARGEKDDKRLEQINKEITFLKYAMWLGRDHYLKADIEANLLKLGIKHEKMLTNKLISDYKKEAHRQAGIMDITLKTDFWRSMPIQKALYAQVHSATFSDRVWANMDVLKAELERDIARELVHGRNPREFSSRLGKLVSNDFEHGKYAGERIARTETARIQYQSAMDLFKQQDQDYVLWTSDPRPCKVCAEIAERNDYGEAGVYKLKDVPAIPQHPNCRCSVCAWSFIDEDKTGDKEAKALISKK